MSGNSNKRGGFLTPEEARAIWYPLIASNKNCSQCGVEIIELAEHGPRQSSPQRMDPSNLSYSGRNCVVFCLFCQFFNLGTPDTEVQPLLVEIAANSNPNICLSSDWTPPMAIPYPSPLPVNAAVDPEYLQWLDINKLTDITHPPSISTSTIEGI